MIVVALLASRAGVAVPSSGSVGVPGAATLTPNASGVDGAHGLSSDSDGATRTAFVRPAPPSITRSQSPISDRDGDMHSTAMRGATPPSLECASLRAPATAEMRRDGVPSPGQPAPASRAPPVG